MQINRQTELIKIEKINPQSIYIQSKIRRNFNIIIYDEFC